VRNLTEEAGRSQYCPPPWLEGQNEVKRVTTSFTGKFSGGYDEIPEYLIKQCIQYIQQPLTYLYNASLTQGIFADRLKVPKYNLFMQKGCLELQITIHFISFF
jgi:hypothetical protein